MHTLFRFLQRHHTFFLFLMLEGIAIFLLLRDNYVQRVAFAKITGALSGNIHERMSVWRSYFRLYEINDQLSNENTGLRNHDSMSFFTPDTSSAMIADTISRRKYLYMAAKVINGTVNKQYNYLTLDRGDEQQVSEDMAVIGPDGIVGVIYGVSDNFAIVLPVINRNFRISTKFKKNNYYGSLSWNGHSYRHAELNEIPLHVPVEMGDTLIVSGYSSSFPTGIPVGTVSRFEKKDGNFYTIEVLLFTDFRKLYHVSVVKDLMQQEQDSLEFLIPNYP
ncbi:MAG: rod shape-determining protein MreC [Bacteroidales bacterium]|jgi:rod shape-determining protein MreC|nr:rod shape-determining protein MreC [Bacteroidales bacterium]